MSDIKRITAVDPESHSVDQVSQNLDQLKALFPEAFTEGKVNFEVLKQLLGGAIDDREEKYGLSWHGKRRARQLALTPSTGTLRPCPKDSVDWDTTQNLMIEGDNLEVLKLLQKSYAGKVKLIYIDPPYNTGNDFVYPDNFKDSLQNYLELTGQVEGGRKIASNSETSGRFHTDWLSMMYPRLKLAKSLLREDGVIFVTLDDVEIGNLRLVMDEVFGAENFVGSIAWKKRSSPDARDTLGSVHDWILCYVRNIDNVKTAIGKMPLAEERRETYANPDNDPRGDWASVDMTGMTARATAEQYFEVVLPSGRKVKPPEGRSWGISKATFDSLSKDNRIWYGKSGDGVPRIKRFLSESEGQVVPSFWDMSEVGSNEEAKKEVNKLMGQADVFDTPKPLRLIRRMVEIAATRSQEPAIVVDFFAGSGTTGHAVMTYNASHSSGLRFILVQLPEPLSLDNKAQATAARFCANLGRPQTLAELTKERLRRAGNQVRSEFPNQLVDLGFRTFRLDTSNIRPWHSNRAAVEDSLAEAIDHLVRERSEEDVFYELLMKLGIDLSTPVEVKTIAGKSVRTVGNGALIACLASEIDSRNGEPLALGIAEWHGVLKPGGDSLIVFRDSAFPNDVVKTNVTAILQQHGLADVRSV